MKTETTYYSIWSDNFENYLKKNKLYFIQKYFNNKFESKYKKILNRYNLTDIGQLNGGNRMRPRIVFWTYLVNLFPLKPRNLINVKLDVIVDICVSIELIHKSSLILDDMLDNDITRKEIPCFHIAHGSKKTGLYGLNLITHSMYILDNALSKLEISTNQKKKIQSLAVNTIDSMSYNAIRDLDLNEKSMFDISEVTKIVHGEVSSLFKYSFLLGYYIGDGNNSLIEEAFIDLGESLGVILQLLNDLEPHRNEKMNFSHKSRINYDFTENQKSLILGYLGEFLTTKEIRDFTSLNSEKQKYDFFMSKMEKYNVWKFVDGQIVLLKKKVTMQSEQLFNLGVNQTWYTHFNNLINLMIQTAEKRLI